MLTRLLLNNGSSKETLIVLLISLPVILISLTVHEFSHGFAAYKCGDMTARNMGRLTLNPLKHLDFFGFLMMMLVGFGWAKPVPINMSNFRKPKRDLGIVSIAGPLSNVILAFISSGLYCFTYFVCAKLQISSTIALVIVDFFYLMIILNLGLAVFNLIPIAPLDGSKILASLLPPKYAVKVLKLEQYSRYIFLAIVLSTWIPFRIGGFSNLSDLLFYPVTFLREFLATSFINLFSFIFFGA